MDFIKKIVTIYKNLFGLLGIVSILMGLSTLTFLVGENTPPTSEVLFTSADLTLIGINMLIWSVIFKTLFRYFNGAKDIFLFLSKLFLATFAINCTVLVMSLLFPQTPINWSQVVAPNFEGHWSGWLLQTYLYCLKISHYFGEFIFPHTVGLVNLLLALIFYLKAKPNSGQ